MGDSEAIQWSKSTTIVRAAKRAEMKAEAGVERAAGFQSNPKIRRCIELYAMDLVRMELERAGYEVKDLSSNMPYDFLCTKGSKIKFVEVKGTQTRGQTVILTSGEVRFIRENRGHCALFVVHGIKVTNDRKPEASGGEIGSDDPFDLETGELDAISYWFRREK